MRYKKTFIGISEISTPNLWPSKKAGNLEGRISTLNLRPKQKTLTPNMFAGC
jgi:hypothetical protein